jgi:hypothetical protein
MIEGLLPNLLPFAKMTVSREPSQKAFFPITSKCAGTSIGLSSDKHFSIVIESGEHRKSSATTRSGGPSNFTIF